MSEIVRKAQVSIEYMLIAGFVTFVVIAILGLAFFYSGSIEDRMRSTQLNNFAEKIVSKSEKVFYAGEPTKTSFKVFLPKGVKNISVESDNLIFTIQTHSGIDTIAFTSKVPISLSGNLTTNWGVKQISIVAETNQAVINQV